MLIDIFQMRDKNILQNRCDLLGPVVKFLRCFNVIIVQYVSSDGIEGFDESDTFFEYIPDWVAWNRNP